MNEFFLCIRTSRYVTFGDLMDFEVAKSLTACLFFWGPKLGGNFVFLMRSNNPIKCSFLLFLQHRNKLCVFDIFVVESSLGFLA